MKEYMMKESIALCTPLMKEYMMKESIALCTPLQSELTKPLA
jgi:hypothetical protein